MSGVSFDIFNYKLTNIASEATGDSDIALRESFNNEKISSKLVTASSAEVKDGAMKLSGGSISMKDKSRYFIANFTVLNSNSDLTVSFSDNKSAIISKDLKNIAINDGANKTVFDVSEYNLSDYKSMQLQLILQYDALSIAAKGIYEPSDKFATPMVEYTFANPVEEGSLKWLSDDALIDDISVYALDHSYKAASVSYEQDPNDTDIWIKKDNVISANGGDSSANLEKNNGISTLFIVIYSVIGAVILALLAFIVVLSVKKRGKVQ